MEKTIKVIITSKKNLSAKYTSDFSAIEDLLATLVKSDLKRKIQTEIIYIDNADSARKAGIKPVASVTRLTAKRAVDAIYEKLKPAYIVLLGAQDVFPFQEIKNPASDDDVTVPTDLPYACNTPYSTNIAKFTGPARVVGRIPDIPGKADIQYLSHVLNAVINYKSKKEEEMSGYFSVTAAVWEKSTRQSLVNIFGNSQNMLKSPPAKAGFNPEDLKAPVHFFNCHGAPVDARYYGQQGNKFPPAFSSADLALKTPGGIVVAAECCYGAQLYDPASEDSNLMSVANAYFKDNALAFAGSSNIAYGPAESQGLADLITQYFIRNILNGSSSGRAMLEARHKFLSVSGPQLDPYEQKTLAQFYLLGDPSIHPVLTDESPDGEDSIQNRRLNLVHKGYNLSATLTVSEPVEILSKRKAPKDEETFRKILQQTNFTGEEKELIYKVTPRKKNKDSFSKVISGDKEITYRVFQKKEPLHDKFSVSDVLVIKESGNMPIGWRIYKVK